MRNRARSGMGPPRMAIGLAVMLSALAIHPAPARACGGFFCDQPGGLLGSQPIAQTGENVLFRVDPTAPAGTSIEAHIQIFYSGPAAQFSWILPVDAAPTLDTGSDSVFTIVSGKTNPSFQVTTTDRGDLPPDHLSARGRRGRLGGGRWRCRRGRCGHQRDRRLPGRRRPLRRGRDPRPRCRPISRPGFRPTATTSRTRRSRSSRPTSARTSTSWR